MKKTLFILALALLGCEETRQTADLIIINANVYTVDEQFSKATAFAVKDGRFTAVGNSEFIESQYVSNQTIDAEGQTIIPGLIDAHCHFYELGLTEQMVDLVGTSSFEEVLERIEAFYNEHHPAVVRGRGWDQNDWEVQEFPTRDQLDILFPEVPVVLERVDGHAFLVNGKMLEMAGIDGNSWMPGGSIIKRAGVPTGILIDSPMSLVTEAIPSPDLETKIRALKDAERICFNNGLTTVNDAGLDKEIISLIDSLQQSGFLSIRIYAMISNSEDNLEHYLRSGIYKSDRLHVRSVKVYADGALGSRGAALKTAYSDQPSHYGAMITPAGEIENLAGRIREAGFQMNTHAIGDSANAVVLRSYQKALNGLADHRWKVEHAQVIDPADLLYFENGIIPSVQPTHATSDMYWAEDRLGEERMPGAYAFRSLMEKAGLVVLGTDFPVEQVNPFHTFYAAVARKDLEGYPPGGFEKQEALSRRQTLRGMTIWPAYSNFEEDEKGSIEIGKWADFVILNKDPMKVAEQEIPTVSAQHVYIAGRIAE